MNRRGVLLVLVVVSMFSLILFLEGASIWRWVSTERIWVLEEFHDGVGIGWSTFDRWTEEQHGPFVVWHCETGSKVWEGVSSPDRTRITFWRSDGTVSGQVEKRAGRTTRRSAPPWLWNASAQSAPSAPWIETGVTPEEWWERVRPRDLDPDDEC